MNSQYPILRASELIVSNSGRILFPPVSATFRSASITALIGENGVGKSTLLDHLAGLKNPLGGQMLLREVALQTFSPRHRCQHIASIGQTDLSRDDVVVADRIAQGLTPRLGSSPPLTEMVVRLVERAASLLQVGHLLKRAVGTLSGGERKRVTIARCLVDDKALVYILDEPFAGIDLRHQKCLSAALKKIAREGKVVVISLHDLDLMRHLPDYIIALGPECIIDAGPREQVLTSTLLEKTFGI